VLVGDREVARLGAGESFGEMALLDQGARSASVVAQESMTLYVIDAQDFGRLLEDVPFLTRKILRGVSNRLRSAEQAPAYVWNRF
ncbi:MAG TPA: cyclic nucleotide-binding domain-containing protein, partial [Actinomycetota bacterium]|nr:cyclic nucleotide-binding domain-containing protein [Actinomycetota bacterium]